MTVFKGKSTAQLGIVEGEALVTSDLVAFWGGTNWETGEIVEVGHEARGKNVAGKILVFPRGKGGAGETFGYYYLFRSGKTPKAMVCNRGMGQTVAGALLGPVFLVNPTMGDLASLKAFAIVILGGLGSTVGSTIGGFAIALVEEFGAGYISADYRDAFSFLVIVAVLILKPQGLFTMKERVG